MSATRFHFGRLIGTLAVLGIATLPLVLIGQTATAPGTAQKFVPAPKAIDYYDGACRRCHGPEGSFYGPELGRGKSDAELVKVIDDMAKGPGNEPLDAAGLAAQTAYHRAIISGTPYVSVTEIKDGALSGEVMTDAKVTVTTGGKEFPATVTDSTWTAKIPADAKDIAITATRNGKKTTLALGAPVAYSNSAPIPATQPTK